MPETPTPAKRGPKGPRAGTVPRQAVTAKIPLELVAWLDQEAARTGDTRAGIIEQAIRERRGE